MNKKFSILSILLLFGLVSVGLVYASLNVSLSDQGTEVKDTSGNLLSSGDLVVLIYQVLTGGSPIYNETFSSAISDGSWNVMIGENTNLPLEFGELYYKDYLIAGEDASFTNGSGASVGRQFFYSPLGDINGTKIIGSGNASLCLKGDGTWGPCAAASLSCPSGFTMIETNGFQTGCIQNTKEGTSTVCQTAVLDCYDTYGGRLPEYSEIYTAVQRYGSSLTDEGTAVEWLDEAHFDGGSGGSSYACGAIDTSGNSYRPSGVLYSATADYRCFIPVNSGSTNNGGGAFYGSLKWDNTLNCEWESGGTTLAPFGADAECDDNARTARGLTTSNTAAGNSEGQLPQIKFASMPAGYYRVVATGSLRVNGTTGISCEFAFNHDLTNQNTSSATIHYGSAKGAVTGYEGEFFFSTDQGASTIAMYGAEYNFDGCAIDVLNDNGDFEIAVYYFPSFGTEKNDTIFSDLDGDTRINVDGDGSDSDNMTFFTNGTQRMVIDSSGNVGIGTSNPDQKLHSQISSTTSAVYAGHFENTGNGASTDGILIELGVTGNPGGDNEFIQFADGDTGDIGAIEGDGAGAITLFSASDRRLKENIRNTRYSLLDLMEIRVRDFNFIGTNKVSTGFVAQELNEVYPLAVSVGDFEEKVQDSWKVSLEKLVPLTVKAIQEQQTQIETLQLQNDLLKQELCLRDSSYSWCSN